VTVSVGTLQIQLPDQHVSVSGATYKWLSSSLVLSFTLGIYARRRTRAIAISRKLRVRFARCFPGDSTGHHGSLQPMTLNH
jgi:hypothetical protein